MDRKISRKIYGASLLALGGLIYGASQTFEFLSRIPFIIILILAMFCGLSGIAIWKSSATIDQDENDKEVESNDQNNV